MSEVTRILSQIEAGDPAAANRIIIFGHVGGDDAYGKSDQSIVMDSFRLIRQ